MSTADEFTELRGVLAGFRRGQLRRPHTSYFAETAQSLHRVNHHLNVDDIHHAALVQKVA